MTNASDATKGKFNARYPQTKQYYQEVIRKSNEKRVSDRVALLESVALQLWGKGEVGPKGLHPELMDPSLNVYLLLDDDLLEQAAECMSRLPVPAACLVNTAAPLSGARTPRVPPVCAVTVLCIGYPVTRLPTVVQAPMCPEGYVMGVLPCTCVPVTHRRCTHAPMPAVPPAAFGCTPLWYAVLLPVPPQIWSSGRTWTRRRLQRW